jgi:glucosamine 6-phosphate synthetase-like amidotransferase/phosphosugar isomerase protein
MKLSESIIKCVEILEGAYSFVLISILEPESMYIVKNTGTMVIGVSKNMMNASESPVQLQDISSPPSFAKKHSSLTVDGQGVEEIKEEHTF